MRILRAADRVFDDGKLVAGQAQYVAHKLGGVNEFGGHHANGRRTKFFGLNRVMQTARRTAASIPDACNG